MDPAKALFSLSLAMLFSMMTSRPPSWHEPFVIHEPAMESVMRIIFSMGLSLKTRLIKSGERCMPSQMSSIVRSWSMRPVPTIPISLWCSGVMAFPKWVRWVRPACLALINCALVASEWAADVVMPRDFASRMTVQAFGRHGAIERTLTGAIVWICFSWLVFGSRMYCWFWAPALEGLMNGPSM